MQLYNVKFSKVKVGNVKYGSESIWKGVNLRFQQSDYWKQPNVKFSKVNFEVRRQCGIWKQGNLIMTIGKKLG